MTAASYTLQVTGERPLTINRVSSMHRQAWAKHTKATRAFWMATAVAMKVPHLDSCTIVATPLHANRAAPQDIAACAPEVKAAIDGLRDAGVLDDDTADIVTRITFEPPRICGHNGLELTIEAAGELTECRACSGSGRRHMASTAGGNGEACMVCDGRGALGYVAGGDAA